jgi:hypothetical protein
MFTPSIVVWLIMNTVAASGAVFVALQASALETGNRVSTSKASTPQAAEKSWTRGGYGLVAWQEGDRSSRETERP